MVGAIIFLDGCINLIGLTLTGDIASKINSDTLLAISIFLVSILMALLAGAILSRYPRQLLNRVHQANLDVDIILTLILPVQLITVLSGAYIALKIPGWSSDAISNALDTIIIIALTLVVAFMFSKIVRVYFEWYGEREKQRDSSTTILSMISFAGKIASIIIYGVAIFLIMSQLDMPITPLIASMGIIGIAVAMAASDVLSNFFGALAILIDRPYRIGDNISISSDEYGQVTDIGLRSTRIKTVDNKVIVVPNVNISNSQIINYCVPDLTRMQYVRIGISFNSDVEMASKILTETAVGISGVMKDPAPVVYVEALGDYSVNLVMLVWVENFRRDWDVPDRIYRQIMKRFFEAGVEVSHPVKSIIYNSC
ncbi:MAG TPA: mechanosensitive ion channel family protein [Methanocella sp.]|nr:mechanosensitive ion channel family protein [Methanocella sp.]